MLIDIDHFKNINDTYGHQVGDMVLQRVSTLFRRSIRSTDIVGRWGGEEFMVLCPQTNINQCNIFAQNLRAKIENYNFPNIKNQTASFGLSTYKEGYSLEELIKQADDALYKSKRNGRNQVSF
jgi:diguanylate cyclase (GGDEF)-like protein